MARVEERRPARAGRINSACGPARSGDRDAADEATVATGDEAGIDGGQAAQ